SHFIKRFNYTNNVIGSVNLLNASINTGVKTFVFTSSIAVYGSTPPPMTEDHVPGPEDSYGIAKYAVEMELRACRDLFGLNYVVFRPHNVFGPRQNIGDRYRNVVGIFMNQILQGRSMTVFGDGAQTRAFSYIDDVAPLMAEAIDTPAAWNETFNVGADQPYSLLQMANAVADAMGVTPSVEHLEARHEVQHAHSSHEKVRRIFGARPQTARYAAPGVETKILDVSRDLASLGTSSFDAVLASNILEHFEPGVASSVVEDVARLLKPGGRLLIVQPNFRFAAKRYFDDYT